MLFNRMCELYMNRLVFKNLPDSVDVPTITYGLLMNGNVCYFNDPVMGDLCLMGTPSKTVDVYNYQTGYYVHTASGYNRHLSVSRFSPERTGVVIYTNYMRTADILIIKSYAERLTAVLRAADVNINNQKTAKIIGTTDAQRLSLENIMKDYDGNVPIIMTDKNYMMGGEEHPIFDMTTPYVADKMWVYFTNIWNDFLTWLGVENANNQKRERLVEDEVNSNYGNVEMERRTALSMVQRCFDDVNKLFKRNIHVEFNSNLPTQLNAAFGGESFGEIYSEDSGVDSVVDGREQGGTEWEDIQPES